MEVPAGDLLTDDGIQLCINPAWADVIGAVVERLSWEDAWQGTPAEVERATQAADELFAALYGETRCVSKPWRAGGGNDMPDCVEFASSDGIHIDTINICEDKCDVPIYVNIYDCCCGDGGKLPGGNGNGDNGNGDIGVGFPELPSPDSPNPTVCDAAFLTAPYVISQGREFLQQADQFVDAGNAGIDFISDVAAGLEIPGAIINAMQEFIENLGELSFEDFDNALSDEDFVLKAQIAWTRTYGENRLQPDVTRQGLRTWANKLPVFWGNVLDGAVFSPRVFFFLFSYFVDMQKVRARQVLAAGTSNASFCNYVYGEAQIPLPELPERTPEPDTEVTIGNLRFTKIVSGITPAPGFDGQVAEATDVENFYGYVYKFTNFNGGRRFDRAKVSVTQDDGTTGSFNGKMENGTTGIGMTFSPSGLSAVDYSQSPILSDLFPGSFDTISNFSGGGFSDVDGTKTATSVTFSLTITDDYIPTVDSIWIVQLV
jgi:hypothetical protein